VTSDYTKYAWFLRIALSSKLPYGYFREIAPDGEIVYYNEGTGEISTKHPLSVFLRKTFSKIVKGEITSNDAHSLQKLIMDENSRIQVEEAVSY
jgi:hypothetical protein